MRVTSQARLNLLVFEIKHTTDLFYGDLLHYFQTARRTRASLIILIGKSTEANADPLKQPHPLLSNRSSIHERALPCKLAGLQQLSVSVNG